ncbi:unnamed protein product, partial [Staurois parvus]
MGVKLAALQLLQNYKSHHASAFGSHAGNCQSCNASGDFGNSWRAASLTPVV